MRAHDLARSPVRRVGRWEWLTGTTGDEHAQLRHQRENEGLTKTCPLYPVRR